MGTHSAEDPFADITGEEFVPGLLVRHRSAREFPTQTVRAWLFWASAATATITASIAVFAAFTAAAL